MRAWIACVVVVLGCKGQDRPAQRSGGSATATATLVTADAHGLDAAAPTLAITCGPAMLAPRIPAPKKKKTAATVDPFADGYGFGMSGLSNVDQIGNGKIGIGQIGTGSGQGVSIGRIGVSASAPTWKIQQVVTKGPLDKAIVERMFKRSRGRFTYCFEQEMATASATSASVRIQMVIDAQGKVRTANVSGNALACVHNAIMAMGDFPQSTDGTITIASLNMSYDAGDSPTSSDGRGVRAMPQPAPKPVAKPPPIPDTRSWTPYAASVGLASDDVMQAAGDELETLMPLAKLETCFAGKNASERTMVTVAFDGGVIGARSGGSGDAQVDACISTSLIGLKVTAPPTVSEIACDIVRGDPQAWRVAPESYTVLEVGDKEIKEGGVVLTKQTLVPAKADATHSFLIVVDPAAPPAMLAAAFERTAWSAATLVALKTEAGAPVFIAMGRDGRTREKDYAQAMAITHDKDNVKSCIDGAERATAPKAEVQTLLQTLANSCDPKPCPATLSIALGGTMQDLAADADAARRAGLPRMGLSTTGCP